MEFGEPMKEKFLLDESVTHVNQGSYGAAPKCVLEQKIKYLYEQENQPDLWFRQKHSKLYEESLAAAAEFLGAKPENLALVDNVTTGINTIVKSLSFSPGDKIIVNSHTYNAIANIAREQDDFKGVEIITVPIPIPIKSEEELVEVFRQEYEKHKPIKLHIFDHITSCSAIVFPVKKLVKLAKEYGALSLIDGAHAPGQLEVNLEDIGADFYSANFYKWCFVPRSCGFLWFSSEHAGKIRPLVTSHGYKQSLNDQFSHCGTRDFSSIFCIPRALEFYKEIGGLKAIQAHAEKLLTPACKSLAAILGTEEIDIPASMKAPCMRLVRLPIENPAQVFAKSGVELSLRSKMNQKLTEFMLKHSVSLVLVFFNNKIWVRYSASVYNTEKDYVLARNSVIKELQEMKSKS